MEGVLCVTTRNESRVQVGFAPAEDSYVLVVDDIPRCEVSRAHWDDFLDWLEHRWGRETWGSFEVFTWPRSGDMGLMVFGPRLQAMVVLTIVPDEWLPLIASLRVMAQQVDVEQVRRGWASDGLKPPLLMAGTHYSRN